MLAADSQDSLVMDYEIRQLDDCDNYQLAFAVNHSTETILVGQSGHATMMRGRDKHEWEGGWIFRSKGQVVLACGWLGHVTTNREDIEAALLQRFC